MNINTSYKYFLTLTSCFGSISSVCASVAPNTESPRPNILIILLDDAGYNDFGFMGSKDLSTPHIDKLAAQGVICSDAHVTASVSGPSRAGLLTGRYQQRSGYECNLGNTLGLDLQEQTIGDLFKSQGYKTYCVGKWHQGDAPEYHPNKRGFDDFYGFVAGGRSYFYRPKKDDAPTNKLKMLQKNGKQVKFDNYMTYELADAASNYIVASDDKPFMMYLSFNAVHTPMEATEEDMALFKGHARQSLAAMTYAVDKAIGRVVETLRSTSKFDNTLIFFLSDNGGAHNNSSSNYPLKGFKGNKFEGGQRVPFFVVYGNRFAGTIEYSGTCSSLDILATSMAAAKIPMMTAKNKLDGVDLIPYISGKTKDAPHDKLFWRKDEMAAIRVGAYKLIRVKDVGIRLYNLEKNLSEDVDLSSKNPRLVKSMLNDLSAWELNLVNPILWHESQGWMDVTKRIHEDLMNNRSVKTFVPTNHKGLK